MGRLIDADALYEDIGNIIPSEDIYKFASQICNAIKNQPTAYNVDAVVKQLEEEAYNGFDITLSKATAIVKRGGVE